MSFWRKWFGGGGGSAEAAAQAPAPTQEHKGFVIHATPFLEGGQHQVSGRITKATETGEREHRFVRADRLASRDDAIDMIFRKGRQIIDERGDRIFD